MDKTKLILGALLIGLGFLYLNQCSEIKDLRSLINLEQGNLKTDTVIRIDTIKIPEPYPIKSAPEVITIYEKEPTKVYENISLIGDSIKLFNVGKDSLLMTSLFLSSYPMNPKLLYFSLSNKSMNLSLMSIDGRVQTNQYKLDLNKYDYSYQLSGMSLKPKNNKWSIKPYLSYNLRIKNQFHDLGFGLKLNTNRFTYEAGLNGYYYPTILKNPGIDLQLGVTYNFN